MNYPLILYHHRKAVYSSRDSGLQPLVMCISECKGKYTHCRLYDKVMGLAAARLIVYSGMIDKVTTPLASTSAVALLKENNIKIAAGKVVDCIMNKDRTGRCPMEIKAEPMTNEAFFQEMSQRISSSKESPRRSASSCDTA